MIPDDAQRTGVRATMIKHEEPECFIDHDRWHGPHGAFILSEGMSGSNYILCCPGCGEMGTPKPGATWTATKGSFADVTTLTLRPSIQRNCECRWHGFLNNGVFELQQRD